MLILFGVTGLVVISFAVWVKNEKKQDALFVAGGSLMFVYSIGIGNVIFSILQAVFVASALVELLKIKK